MIGTVNLKRMNIFFYTELYITSTLQTEQICMAAQHFPPKRSWKFKLKNDLIIQIGTAE